MNIVDIFQAKATQLTWDRLDNGSPNSPNMKSNQAYFMVRLKEMYVAVARRLWRRYYPMLHSYVEHGPIKENAVAGPGQLREFGDSGLERIVNLNYRLAGPIVFSGEDVSMLVGLYSVPGDDAAKALIETVSSFAALAGIGGAPAVEISTAVKSGVEKIAGLNDSKLQLGVRDSFYSGRPLRAGVYVGVSGPQGSVDFSKLWLRGGRLHHGNAIVSATPYQDHDYMVIELEQRDTREDWPSLPGIAEFQERFSDIMGNSALAAAEKRSKLGELWPAFQQALEASKLLTQPDKETIADSVLRDLRRRLDAMQKGNPFETRGWGQGKAARLSAESFDLVDVERYTDRNDPEQVRRSREALRGQPFASA